MRFELYYPVRPIFFNQKFGETSNLAYYKANGIEFTGHNGIDMATKHSQPVYASHDGIVEVQVDINQGHGVVITTQQDYEYKGGVAKFKSISWHLIDDIPVKTGQLVKAGDIIGYADNTGLSTGDHLHFGLKPIKLVNKSPVNIEQNNGYMGAIDPAPYFNGKYATDIHLEKPVHTFNTTIRIGDSSEEVMILQRCLKHLGYFPFEIDVTGFYGAVTKKAVYDFQMKYIASQGLSALLEVWFNKGDAVYSKTRAELNKLFGTQ